MIDKFKRYIVNERLLNSLLEKKCFFGDFLTLGHWHTSGLFTLRANKPAIKRLLKKLSFEVDVQLKVPPLPYKINAHILSGVKS